MSIHSYTRSDWIALRLIYEPPCYHLLLSALVLWQMLRFFLGRQSVLLIYQFADII